MNRPPAMSFAFPRPGRALWIVLVAMAVVGIASAIFANLLPVAAAAFDGLVFEPARAFAQPWRLLSSALLTSPASWSHLLFSLLGLYFLGAPLERRMGSGRFVRFLVIAVIAGNLATAAVYALSPPGQERFHPDVVFGPAAAIAAVAVAWSREYPDSLVNLFLFVPLKGKTFLWITIGLAALDLIYPSGIPEGVVAPFGGIVTGLLLGGTPSLSRTLWLQTRLALLRRRSGSGLRAKDLLSNAAPTRRARPGSPPLRVVPGGLDDVLKKRTPPKDKRYLN